MGARRFLLTELLGAPSGRYRLDTASGSVAPASDLQLPEPVLVHKRGQVPPVVVAASSEVLYAKRLLASGTGTPVALASVEADEQPAADVPSSNPLSAFSAIVAGGDHTLLTAGSAHWTLDVVAGDDIGIDGDDNTLITLAEGKAYLVQAQLESGGGTGTAVELNWTPTNALGVDGAYAVESTSTQAGVTFWVWAAAGCTLALTLTSKDGDGSEHYSFSGIDIVCLGTTATPA